jgi:DNA-binding GntR family transcriptional regulator
LFDQMRLVRFRTSAFIPRLQSALVQHLELVDIFERGDSELAERFMRAHIEESIHYVDQWEQMQQGSSMEGRASG